LKLSTSAEESLYIIQWVSSNGKGMQYFHKRLLCNNFKTDPSIITQPRNLLPHSQTLLPAFHCIAV